MPNWPDTDKALASLSAPIATLRLNASYLEKMAKAFKDLARHAKTAPYIELDIRDDQSPITMRASFAGQEASGFIAPCRR